MAPEREPTALGLVVRPGEDGAASAHIPPEATLRELAEVAATCTACHLHERATQTVFGAGPDTARLVVVGEQPGDREDIEGEPFVGPAGAELERALEAVEIDRADVYVTNVVKHFKFERRRKRRIHERPNRIEIDACLPWLRAEVDRLRPDVVLTLGATAGQAVIGTAFRVTRQRGDLFPAPGVLATGTVHPASVLRAPGDADRRAARAEFRADLQTISLLLHEGLAAALRSRTVDQLRRQARSLDVEGRSTMDKEALVTAVGAALHAAME